MKRKQLLYISDCNEKRFDTLQTREQLPFYKTRGRWAEYSLEDAFRLRLMLDLIGGEAPSDPLGGLSHKTALSITQNTLSKHSILQGETALEDLAEADWWIGVNICEETDVRQIRHRYAVWFSGPLEVITSSLSNVVTADSQEDGSGEKSIRAFFVNASNAARFVLVRNAKYVADNNDQ